MKWYLVFNKYLNLCRGKIVYIYISNYADWINLFDILTCEKFNVLISVLSDMQYNV